jgi:hypothetical protein
MTFRDFLKEFLCKLGFVLCWPTSLPKSESDSDISDY